MRRKRQKNGITPAALRSFVPILQSVLLSDLKVPSIDVLTGLSRPGMEKTFLVTFTFYLYLQNKKNIENKTKNLQKL